MMTFILITLDEYHGKAGYSSINNSYEESRKSHFQKLFLDRGRQFDLINGISNR